MTATAGDAAVGRRRRDGGASLLTLWYALTAGVAWWTVHLISLAALAPAACDHAWVRWVMHGSTAVCAAGVLSSLAAAARVRRRAEARPGPIGTGRDRFLGRLAGSLGLASLALVALEDVPVWFLHPC